MPYRHSRRRFSAPDHDITQTQPALARRPALRQTIADILQTVAHTALIFLIITSLIGRFEIHQTSMEPNFHEGQRVIVSQLGSALPAWLASRAHAATGSSSAPFDLQHGQVVVFYRTPQRTEDPLIKRVIGLPGETVEIRDGQVFVNGVTIDEPYARGVQTTCSSYCGPLTLGPEEYFFMGDNRTVSMDSRSFGPIPASQIVGRVVMRFWPLEVFTVYS